MCFRSFSLFRALPLRHMPETALSIFPLTRLLRAKDIALSGKKAMQTENTISIFRQEATFPRLKPGSLQAARSMSEKRSSATEKRQTPLPAAESSPLPAAAAAIRWLCLSPKTFPQCLLKPRAVRLKLFMPISRTKRRAPLPFLRTES